MLDKIWKYITAIYDFIVAFPEWFMGFVFNVLGYCIDLGFSVVAFVLEYTLKLVSIPSSLLGSAANMAGLPPTGVYLLTSLGLGEIMAMIASAYAVRFALNLIPSWATRA